jgi:hypothetical protein
MARPLGSSAPHGTRGDGHDRGSSSRPPMGRLTPPGGGPLGGSTILVGLLAVAGVGLLVGAAVFASGDPGASSDPPASPGTAVTSAPGTLIPGGSSPNPSGAPSEAPTAPAATAVEVPLALVADVREVRTGLSADAVARVIADGRAVVPCGLAGLALDGEPVALAAATCLDASKITAAVRAKEPRYGLLPAGMVTPRVKVLQVGGGDLFGAPSVRGRAYPLAATATAPPASWTAFDPSEVRTLISTGDTCPDRGVSHQSNTLGKGWEWVLDGGTAEYTSIRMDRRFDGPDGNGWPVVVARRTGNEGAVRKLISDAEITLNDFECPMTKKFRQHDTGTIFSIDPKVAPLLAGAGVDVVTLASNHMTDQGEAALKETLRLFDKNKIARFGAGMNLEEALEPAVIDVRGVRFAFVGFNEIPGSAKASATNPGVAYLEDDVVRAAVAAAREVADVVIVVPQWGWPEYHANFTARQKRQMKLFREAGADHVLGHGTHWASAVSITKGDRGHRFVISSHGNFLFGQDWSRQTQEGVIPELTFVGTTLVQARLHPYIMLDQAQANLTDPVTDGKYVLNQVWGVSILK